MNLIDPQIDEQSEFAKLLDAYDYPAPQRGEVLTGAVLKKDQDAIYIDVGAKRSAVIPYEEMQSLDADWISNLEIGEELSVYVTRTPRGDNDLIVSVEKMLMEADWDRAENIAETGESITIKVTGHNRGGLLVEFGRLTGFVPNSHIPGLRTVNSSHKKQSYKQKLVDETISVQVLEIQRLRDRLVFSGTAAEQQAAHAQLRDLVEGQTITGRVVSLKPYGAFIEFGYLTGLLHISKMAWEKIDHPRDVVAIDDEMELLIDKIDVDRQRVSLNLKDLLPHPLTVFADTHRVGDLVEGTVSDLADFGAFIEVADGVTGLLHISETIGLPNAHPSEIFQPGEPVLVKVVDIDVARGRIGLSQKQISQEDQIAWMKARAAEEVELPQEMVEEEVELAEVAEAPVEELVEEALA